MQERCAVCVECTIGSEVVLDAPDGTPRCVGHVESRFNLFEDHVSVNAICVHGLSQTYHRLRKSFWMHPTILQGDEAQVEACLSSFGDSAILDARQVRG
jgi:hypothetical protein